jgi:hypothetical protein
MIERAVVPQMRRDMVSREEYFIKLSQFYGFAGLKGEVLIEKWRSELEGDFDFLFDSLAIFDGWKELPTTQ